MPGQGGGGGGGGVEPPGRGSFRSGWLHLQQAHGAQAAPEARAAHLSGHAPVVRLPGADSEGVCGPHCSADANPRICGNMVGCVHLWKEGLVRPRGPLQISTNDFPLDLKRYPYSGLPFTV